MEGRLVPSTAILGYHGDNFSDGQNVTETVLTPANVNVQSFGKLLTVPVDGQIYAQPLYVPAVTITTGSNPGLHNVVYVATEFDSLYAVDADTGSVLWKDSLLNGPPGVSATVTPVPANDASPPPSQAIVPWIGITGTPVIDPSTDTIYVDANTKEVYGGNSHYVHRLHAIDLRSGAEQFGGPYTIGDTITNDLSTYVNTSAARVNGSGQESVNGVITFNALRELQRPGLTLSQGVVYVAYGSHDDIIPYHGWLLGFNHAGPNGTLQMVAAFNTSPNGGRAAIWQSGGRVAADEQGNLYFETGNGSLDSALDANGFPAQGDYGQAFVKVAPDPTSTPTHQNINGWGLKVVDYFRPDNAAALNTGDHDLGSGGPLLVPGTNLLIGGGKLGTLYVIDRTNMGKFDPNADHVIQELTVTPDWITPAYFNGQVYFVGLSQTGTPAETFAVSGGMLNPVPTSQSPDGYNFPASTPTISANGTSNGIVWDVNQQTNELRAYTAASYAHELYTSSQAANNRDVPDPFNKFVVPTVADGRVFLGTSDNLTIYGLLQVRTEYAVAVLPGHGVWRFQPDTGWLQLPYYGNDASQAVVNKQGDVAAIFFGSQVWRCLNGQDWVFLGNTIRCTQLGIDDTGAVIGLFPHFGVWRNAGSGWTQLPYYGNDPSQIAVNGRGDVAAIFVPPPDPAHPQLGQGQVWRCLNGGTWAFMNNGLVCTQVGIDDSGAVTGLFPNEKLFANEGQVSGVWRNPGSGWVHLPYYGNDPSQIAVDGNGDVAGIFFGGQVWRLMLGGDWVNMNNLLTCTQVAINDSGAVTGEFPHSGVWRNENGTQWLQLTINNQTADGVWVGAAG